MSVQWISRCGKATLTFSSIIIFSLSATIALAQQEGESDEPIEEITVTGSQIKGAKISDALAISVVSAEDIEVLGIDSSNKLLFGISFGYEIEDAAVNSCHTDRGELTDIVHFHP